jgi:hypothetical protein
MFSMRSFDVGERVRIVGHWEFADGIVGTIAEPEPYNLELAEPGEWRAHRRTCESPKGPIVFCCIIFDEPTDDGSGDGPYLGAEMEADCLEPVSAISENPISNWPTTETPPNWHRSTEFDMIGLGTAGFDPAEIAFQLTIPTSELRAAC